MEVDNDTAGVSPCDYALICTSWTIPDPTKPGKVVTKYRCPKEACSSIKLEKFENCDNYPDGRYVFVNSSSGWSNLKTHLSSCIGSECINMVKEAKKLQDESKTRGNWQRTLLFNMPILASLKTRTHHEKVIFDFIQMIVDKDAPISCVDDDFYRTLVYHSHGLTGLLALVNLFARRKKNNWIIGQ